MLCMLAGFDRKVFCHLIWIVIRDYFNIIKCLFFHSLSFGFSPAHFQWIGDVRSFSTVPLWNGCMCVDCMCVLETGTVIWFLQPTFFVGISQLEVRSFYFFRLCHFIVLSCVILFFYPLFLNHYFAMCLPSSLPS